LRHRRPNLLLRNPATHPAPEPRLRHAQIAPAGLDQEFQIRFAPALAGATVEPERVLVLVKVADGLEPDRRHCLGLSFSQHYVRHFCRIS
jgi:hypothetical protein